MTKGEAWGYLAWYVFSRGLAAWLIVRSACWILGVMWDLSGSGLADVLKQIGG